MPRYKKQFKDGIEVGSWISQKTKDTLDKITKHSGDSRSKLIRHFINEGLKHHFSDFTFKHEKLSPARPPTPKQETPSAYCIKCHAKKAYLDKIEKAYQCTNPKCRSYLVIPQNKELRQYQLQVIELKNFIEKEIDFSIKPSTVSLY
ncbi:MAG: hypothetical protein HWN66_09070 [Candidatus Helarchaeota archaeon]|nr:hypothetical protein [Candidatus Helarchaeota archaeon]